MNFTKTKTYPTCLAVPHSKPCFGIGAANWHGVKLSSCFAEIFIFLLIFAGVFGVVGKSEAATTSSISNNGVTWYFDQEYEYGQFVNGDWWVVGPVTITNITPSFDGLHNGWESNPAVDYTQGLEAFTYGGGWDASLVPELPYNAVAGESLIKGVSIPTGTVFPADREPSESGCRGDCLSTVSILTVVSTPLGANVFRPPYMGTAKPLYYIDNLRTELLPTLTPVGTPLTIQAVVDRYKKVQLNHEKGAMGRAIRPRDHMNDYQPKNAEDYNDAILRMMLNDSVETKMPALIQLVQYGIDTGYSILNGQTFPAGGGHQPAHRIVAAFAATMLDITELKEELNTATYFHEEHFVHESSLGNSLWGEASTESGYWNYIMGLGGSRSQKDPYGYIDGGKCGTDYQYITTQAHKGEILATLLMPSLQSAWNPTKWDITKRYAERWVINGIQAQPDPCAPKTANKVITSMTAGNPTIIISDGHGFSNGDSIALIGFEDDDGEILNSKFHTISNVTANTFSISVDATLSGIKVGGNTAAVWGYGTLYGPDLANPGMCILDPDLDYYNGPTDFACQAGKECGRYPEKHGTLADTGQYRSTFVAAMWDAYYSDYLSQPNFRADVDGSSEITTTDALLTLRNSLGLSMSGTAWQQASATTGDVNCDGSSNSTDALLILRYSLGLSMDETGWCG